jgi:pimeloyl-ACP methyl ester carboxylesterase
MATYPIVKAITSDGLPLHGLLLEPPRHSATILLHVHGAAGTFYGNSYFELLSTMVLELGVAYLATNNRGAGVYELERGTIPHGVSLEKFEDCLLDIDAWIDFALRRGYEAIVLEGHSYGTEKSVYYLSRGKHRDNIKGVILFGFSDNVGSQLKYEQKIGENYLAEARALVGRGEGHRLLNDLFGLCGELPISAQTYLNCFSDDSANATALPLRKGRDLPLFRDIQVPILGVIGDQEEREYTVIPIRQAIELMHSENPRAEVYQLEHCGHGFVGKEAKLVALVRDFLIHRILAPSP